VKDTVRRGRRRARVCVRRAAWVGVVKEGGRRAPRSLSSAPYTHKVDADGGDVGLRVGVVLRGLGCCGVERRGVRESTEEAGEARPARGGQKKKKPTALPLLKRRTANRSSKQDLPTPESPISSSCAWVGGSGVGCV